ncbi:MAG: LuxR C-terminal-related transcriptional regulator [Xanthobacteraceae bacterium]|nr:LuxR C-terminal-related transcriptional regulator [Xanthobacteraceae bacterium]
MRNKATDSRRARLSDHNHVACVLGRGVEDDSDRVTGPDLGHRPHAGLLQPRARTVDDRAPNLDISPRTVENHRAWVMEKMDASNLADPVRKVIALTPRKP